MIQDFVEEEMEIIKNDPRYNIRSSYEKSRHYSSKSFIKSLPKEYQLLYFLTVIIAIICIIAMVIIFFRLERQKQYFILYGCVLLILTYFGSKQLFYS